jgi:hypothetical protein
MNNEINDLKSALTTAVKLRIRCEKSLEIAISALEKISNDSTDESIKLIARRAINNIVYPGAKAGD